MTYLNTLRACFATHLLAKGVEPMKVMRKGGWSDRYDVD